MESPKYKIVGYISNNIHPTSTRMIFKYMDGEWIVSKHGLLHYVNTGRIIIFPGLSDTTKFHEVTKHYRKETVMELKDDEELEEYLNRLRIIQELEEWPIH